MWTPSEVVAYRVSGISTGLSSVPAVPPAMGARCSIVSGRNKSTGGIDRSHLLPIEREVGGQLLCHPQTCCFPSGVPSRPTRGRAGRPAAISHPGRSGRRSAGRMGLVVKCEFVSETDPPVLTIPPEGQARPGAGLLLVECGA